MDFKFRGIHWKLDTLFLVTVVLPTLGAIIYFGFLASDVYVSVSQFVVRSPEKPSSSALGFILKSAGFSNAGDEIFAAKNYIVSRDALATLNRNNAVEKAYSNSSISVFDRFDPLGTSGSFESLFKYFGKKTSVELDTPSSTTTLTVRAYTPQDAYLFNKQLLEQSEALVNRLNVRGRKDLITYALAEVREAKIEATRAALALADYRNRRGVIDPERQAQVQLQMISKLQDELIGARNQLEQLRATVPENPQIQPLQVRIASLQSEINHQLGLVAGDQSSLSAAASQYQRLTLERELADRQLAAAINSLQEAQSEARRKQAYVERIVQPNLPDEALEPRRIRNILATLLLSVIVWGVISMFVAGVKEHQD